MADHVENLLIAFENWLTIREAYWRNESDPESMSSVRSDLADALRSFLSFTPILAEEENVVEEWAVIDKWWTDDPERRNYRRVVVSGREYDEVFVDGEWRLWNAAQKLPPAGDLAQEIRSTLRYLVRGEIGDVDVTTALAALDELERRLERFEKG